MHLSVAQEFGVFEARNHAEHASLFAKTHVILKADQVETPRARVLLTKGSPHTQRVFELSGALEYLPFVSD